MKTQKPEQLYYEVFPKVVRADSETLITIKPLYSHCSFNSTKGYRVSVMPMDRYTGKDRYTPPSAFDTMPDKGVLRIPHCFEGEQEHLIAVDEISDSGPRRIGVFSVYSLEEDLYSRYPYKGDLHMHSYYSDGKEAPAYVASSCRLIGLDFMAVTDHGRYFPSIEAQETFSSLDIDLKIFRGEEVHPPENPVHMINFGGNASINEMFTDTDRYYSEVKAIEEQLEDCPRGVSGYQYASCAWCFDRIREAGGLGIFCHPYWVVSDGYTPSTMLTSYMFDKQPYDAYEVIGGFYEHEVDSNTLQVARYNEERSKGRRIPIVGVSDAHGCSNGKLFGWYYTIVFSQDTQLQQLIGGIKELYSVAVEAMADESVRVYGPFRLVKYALFLIREVFPKHDEMCLEEGRLMLRHISGDPQAAVMLGALKGQTSALLNKYWGRSWS